MSLFVCYARLRENAEDYQHKTFSLLSETTQISCMPIDMVYELRTGLKSTLQGEVCCVLQLFVDLYFTINMVVTIIKTTLTRKQT